MIVIIPHQDLIMDGILVMNYKRYKQFKMNFGKKIDLSRIIPTIIASIATAYLIGSMIFFVNMSAFSRTYENQANDFNNELIALKIDLKNTNKNQFRLDTVGNYKFNLINIRINDINNTNSTEHVSIIKELKQFKYIVLKGNDKLLKELKTIQNYELLSEKKAKNVYNKGFN